jgi:hypothetical protein
VDVLRSKPAKAVEILKASESDRKDNGFESTDFSTLTPRLIALGEIGNLPFFKGDSELSSIAL